VAEIDGSQIVKKSLSGPADKTETVGATLAEQLLSMGADNILDKLQSMEP
jgi:porphobilinogen deaminase